jgi:hypothetical protein
MYRLYSISIAAFVFLLLLSSSVRADEYPVKPQKSTTGAVLRSLVFPGWGQLYNEQYLKSAAFFIAEGSFIAGISHQNDLMLASKHNNLDDFQDEKFYRNSRNKLIWWLSATVLLSLGDAYVDAKLFGLDISPDLSVNDSGTPGLVASISF